MPETEKPADPAAKRFWLLQLARLSGVVMAALGTMILAGSLDAPPALGVVLLAAGITEFFFLPPFLARKWRSGG